MGGGILQPTPEQLAGCSFADGGIEGPLVGGDRFSHGAIKIRLKGGIGGRQHSLRDAHCDR